jgi:hypothetical protein
VWLRLLRQKFPTKNPVTLRFELMPGFSGMCESNEVGHTITMNDKFIGPITFFLDTLLHEYAHALQFEDPRPQEDDHDDVFGHYYAALIRWAYAHRMWP